MVRGAAGKKPLSVAIDEFYQGQVKIVADNKNEEKLAEQTEEMAAQTAENAADNTAGETLE